MIKCKRCLYDIGYYLRSNHQFTPFVLITLHEPVLIDGEENYVLILELTEEQIHFVEDEYVGIYVTLADIEAAVAAINQANGIALTPDMYDVTITLVPDGADSLFDYAITFADLEGADEIDYVIKNTEFIVEYVAEGETVEFTICPETSGYWDIEVMSSYYSYFYIYNSDGGMMCGSGAGHHIANPYFNAGETYTVTFTMSSTTNECYVAFSFTQTIIDTPTTFYYYNDSWTQAYIFLWNWDEVNDLRSYADWPGYAMTPVEGMDGWYTATIDCNVDRDLFLIFTDWSEQTADLTYDGNAWWVGETSYSTYEEAVVAIEELENRQIDWYLAGSFNDWTASDPLVYNENGIASIEVTLYEGDEFKIADVTRGWSPELNVNHLPEEAFAYFGGYGGGNIVVNVAGTYRFSVVDGRIFVEVCDGSANNGHTFNVPYVRNSTHHWLQCVNCFDVINKEEHAFDEEGICLVCNYGGISYTYNYSITSFPSVWNPHTYQTATERSILDYTNVGLYAYDHNQNNAGFTIVPEMAAGMPVDVTSSFVGEEWGIAAGESSRVWLITLRSDLRWEDGTSITAYDFVESVKRFLAPEAGNYRASDLYEGVFILANAKNYFRGGKEVMEDNSSTRRYTMSDFVIDADGVYTTPEGMPVWIATNSPTDWLGGNSLADYVNAYGASVFGMDSWEELIALADENGNVRLTDTSLAHLVGVITAVEAWGETAAEACNYLYYANACSEVDFSTVGIRALSDTELVLILESSLEGFDLKNALCTDLGLVHIPTYDACASYDADGVYTNTYGTSVDTFMSFGPYKLVAFDCNNQIILEKNEQWYGYSDPAYVGQYQTTRVVLEYYENDEQALEAFLQGKLDSKDLSDEQVADYGMSENIYYADNADTYFIAMNPDAEAFTRWEANNPGKDKHIMTVKEFRMALSFALDRKSFNLYSSRSDSAAFAVFNNMIISDPENGTAYRSTEQAKDIILEFWGISQNQIGEGKEYATKDDAIASITGYNLDYAKELFNQAYDKAIAEGLMTETDVVEICIGLPSHARFYVNGYDFLTNCYTEAVKGTKLEGKLIFTKDDTIGNGFSDALEANQVNLLFGVGWRGSSLDPYNLMMAYTTPGFQYDVNGWNTAVETLDITLASQGGKTYRTTVENWTYIMMGYEYEIFEVDAFGNEIAGSKIIYSCGPNDVKNGGAEMKEERLNIFAALESAVLRTYDLLPLCNGSDAHLKGMQVQYGVEYSYGIGFGGLKYMTYNYTDVEWDAYVESLGGEIDYK